MALVNTNTAAKTTKTIPIVPVTVPVKYNAANTMAKMILIPRSKFDMFFFMIKKLNREEKENK